MMNTWSYGGPIGRRSDRDARLRTGRDGGRPGVAAVESERKYVTVMFADVRGSLELLAHRDPEEAQRVLEPVLEQLIRAVRRYGGTVTQVLGDGIMALFGAPVAYEDHALRACSSALAMQQAVRELSRELERTRGIQLRVGLNSGEVVVRATISDVQKDYSAVGETTHVAARIEQLAEPGTVALTAHTLNLVDGLARAHTSAGPPRSRPISGCVRCSRTVISVGVFSIGVRSAPTRPPARSRAPPPCCTPSA